MGLSLLSTAAQAQYTFSDSNLSPYRQSFNTLSGNAAMTGNQLTAIPEMYAEANFSGTPFTPTVIYANDGSYSAASYYHFGSNTDRAFGGIGGFLPSSTVPGVGYVGLRLKNNSSKTITSLEISYAMEQWYNSTFTTAAQVDVTYQTVPVGTAITSLATGTWTPISALSVAAPSTATTIGKRDGNAPSNRRVQNATVAIPDGLVAGQEVMIRWAYTLNSNTNGNGLSIDDVVVTPETTVFYSKATGDLNSLATWGSNTDGTGTAPTSFTADNQIFYVQSASATTAVDRIGASDTGLGSTWTVSGANSKIVLGSATTPAAMIVTTQKNISGTIDVGPGSLFQHNHGNSPALPAFTFGTLDATSTVDYNQSSVPMTVQAGQYGTLKISGSTTGADRSTNRKDLAGNVVARSLGLNGNGNLVLGNYDVTVLNSSGTLSNFGPTNYVVTNGTGRLRLPVPRGSSTAAGTKQTFPVGTSITSYTPVTLQQEKGSTASDNVFEVRVLDGVYRTYNASTYAPTGPTVGGGQMVNKTWLISKEVAANAATATLTTQWNSNEQSADFVPATAHINHYTGGGWDVYATELGIGTSTGPYVATRSGINNFSPFAVSSRLNGTLPVELLAFDAKRAGAAVACTWATASEKNSAYFVVERSSTGEGFTSIGQVNAAGSSTTRQQYRFDDRAPLAGPAYYRLRQTDLDGTVSYSPVVAVQALSYAGQAAAVPNPSTGHFEIAVANTETTSAEVMTVVGARVSAPATPTAAGTLGFDLSAQPAGVYLVRLRTAAGVQVVRVIKQ